MLIKFMLPTLTLVLLISACSESSKGHRYYLPEMYAGWVCVYYDVDNAPPLPVEDGYLVVKIPENGIVKTSSRPRGEKLKSEYYYYGARGIRSAMELKLGGGFTVQKEGEKQFVSYWWISSNDANADYERYVKNRDVNTVPQCGPWGGSKK